MALGGIPNGDARLAPSRTPANDRSHTILVALNDEQMAAVEGWRAAHGISDRPEALGQLIQLGLLSEIAKIYRLVSENRTPTSRRPRKRQRSDQ